MKQTKTNQRQVQKLKTRKTIFETATTLFAEKSYEKVTIAEICKVAGVSIGAFYHHFKNKESVLNEGYFWFDEDLKDDWKNRNTSSVEEDIIFLIKEQLKAISANGYIYATQFFKNQLTNKVKYILNEDRLFYKLLYLSVSKGIDMNLYNADATKMTKKILSLSRGTIYDWCLHEGSYNLIDECLEDLQMLLKFCSLNK